MSTRAAAAASSSFKLIGAAWTRAFRCVWMLEELGIPYQILDNHDPGTESVKRYNPSGKVPVLLEYNNSGAKDAEPCFILTESTAINTYLGDCFPESGLVPPRPAGGGDGSSDTSTLRDRARYDSTTCRKLPILRDLILTNATPWWPNNYCLWTAAAATIVLVVVPPPPPPPP
jgi:Glutathione S-transferase, N-terminal domain